MNLEKIVKSAVNEVLKKEAETEGDMEYIISDALERHYDVECSTFQEVGALTGNKGIVARFDNGDEFFITIVQSKDGEGEIEELEEEEY